LAVIWQYGQDLQAVISRRSLTFPFTWRTSVSISSAIRFSSYSCHVCWWILPLYCGKFC